MSADELIASQQETPTDGGAPEQQPSEPDEQTYWYGWQTLSADGVAAAAIVGGALSESSEWATLGVGTALLAPPIIHVANDQTREGVASLLLRVSAGLVWGIPVGVCWVKSEPEDGPWCEVSYGVAGAATATVIVADAAFLAHAPVEDEWTWVPSVTPWVGRHGGGALARGRF